MLKCSSFPILYNGMNITLGYRIFTIMININTITTDLLYYL